MVRIDVIDNHDPAIAARIAEIQQAAYAVEAQMIGFDGIPPLHEQAEDVMAFDTMTWLGVFDDDVLVGVVAWTELGAAIDIERLAVHPHASRRGFGRALVRRVPQGGSVTVATGAANAPAIALYTSEGFVEQRQIEVEPGVIMTQLVRSSSELDTAEADG